MEISKKDYLLLTGMIEFHFKFSEYIREIDHDLFYRAIDYAKTFTDVEGMEFGYWHENNKKFLEEINTMVAKRKSSYARLLEKVNGDEKKARDIWKKKKNTTDDDFFGMKNMFANFMHHSKELNYEEFDMEDWVNFVKACKHVKDNSSFIEFALAKIAEYNTQDSELYKELKNEQES